MNIYDKFIKFLSFPDEIISKDNKYDNEKNKIILKNQGHFSLNVTDDFEDLNIFSKDIIFVTLNIDTNKSEIISKAIESFQSTNDVVITIENLNENELDGELPFFISGKSFSIKNSNLNFEKLRIKNTPDFTHLSFLKCDIISTLKLNIVVETILFNKCYFKEKKQYFKGIISKNIFLTSCDISDISISDVNEYENIVITNSNIRAVANVKQKDKIKIIHNAFPFNLDTKYIKNFSFEDTIVNNTNFKLQNYMTKIKLNLVEKMYDDKIIINDDTLIAMVNGLIYYQNKELNKKNNLKLLGFYRDISSFYTINKYSSIFNVGDDKSIILKNKPMFKILTLNNISKDKTKNDFNVFIDFRNNKIFQYDVEVLHLIEKNIKETESIFNSTFDINKNFKNIINIFPSHVSSSDFKIMKSEVEFEDVTLEMKDSFHFNKNIEVIQISNDFYIVIEPNNNINATLIKKS